MESFRSKFRRFMYNNAALLFAMAAALVVAVFVAL
jgi:hypothetical protein